MRRSKSKNRALASPCPLWNVAREQRDFDMDAPAKPAFKELVFSGVHVWTADTASAQLRAAWVTALDGIAARQPAVVVAGHMVLDAQTNASAIAYTRSYLLAFEEELSKASTSTELIVAMTARYPDAGMAIALQIGAKVVTGEMKWG